MCSKYLIKTCPAIEGGIEKGNKKDWKGTEVIVKV